MRILLALSVAALSAGAQDAKQVIAHRGASGYLPEHTLEAYAMAHALGADYIEPDLVRTKDGHFICLHDIHLEATTDVEDRFPNRKRADNRWYAADLSLAEIKTLQAHERLPKRFPQGKSDFEVPTFQEMIELVQGLNQSTGRDVGIYPELKNPAWHKDAGLAMEADFLAILQKYGYVGKTARVFVQCFEAETLRNMRLELGSELPQIQLLSNHKIQDALVTQEGLDRIAEYANGIGPDRRRVEKNPQLVQWAHARGLCVHPYTLREDQRSKAFDSFAEELKQFYFVYDVDALFTDHPGAAAQVIRQSGGE